MPKGLKEAVQEMSEVLREILGSDSVYFQPPPNIHIKYPAIEYELENELNKFAGNEVYKKNMKFKVVYISQNPVSEIVDKLTNLRYSTLDTFFKSEGLNHFVFSIYV